MANNFVQRFMFASIPVRGVYVELTDVFETIANQKEYPEGILRIIGELMVANIMMTSNIKLDGKVIVQLQNNKCYDLIVSECTNELTVRATAKFENSLHQDIQADYVSCLKEGSLVISIDSESDGQLYQSVVSLMGQDLAEVITEYMMQSEQLKTVFKIAYSKEKVVGFMLQQLPDYNESFSEEIERLFILGNTLTNNELLNLGLSKVLNYLFNEDDIYVYNNQNIEFKCKCSRERVCNMIRGLGIDEAKSIIADEGIISVTCDFCNSNYKFDDEDINNIFNQIDIDIECVSQEIH